MSAAGVATPLMDQYEGVKARYPGHLVLIRVGDFFETFGDDAKLLSKELDLTLTARSADASGQRMPMAGVPQHSVEGYLGRLVRKGYKVALCDQVEDPKVAKGLVRREVTRVVTPGTVVEDRILPGPDHNFLGSVHVGPGGPGEYAVVDITTGEWYEGVAEEPGVDGLASALAPFAPREVLFRADGPPETTESLRSTLHREFPHARLELAPASAASVPVGLASSRAPGELSVAGSSLVAYVGATQPKLLRYLEAVPRAMGGRRLVLDAKTLRHLEISRPMNPDDADGATLLSVWDETVTAPGRRTIGFWLKNPLADPTTIAQRQEGVEALVQSGAQLLGLRADLAKVADLARIASRLASRRLRPYELGALRDGLQAIRSVRDWVNRAAPAPPTVLARLVGSLDPPAALVELLDTSLVDPLPATTAMRDLFRPGYAPALEASRAGEQEGVRALEAYERELQQRTGIRTLRVGFNQVFGYYLDVSRPNLAKVPIEFRRKQTLAGGERFTTDRLEEIATAILAARERLEEEEEALWENFLTAIEPFLPAVYRIARAVGELDALATFAWIAQTRGHRRPTVDESRELRIREGRHPVLERTLGTNFVPNDTDLSAPDARVVVLTGPNMSGKSTYMRQVGLLVVLAQAGAFVPAEFAHIGIVTSLYTRMGFTDEIGRGKSSFMVEMSEVAEILRSADDRSLVLLDEVGRGTSTFDGLALAWATLRHLHDQTRCRTLLATHYHHLTELIERLPGASNAHLAVREERGEVVFLHRLVPGSTDRSYGLHVARLAGLPSGLLEEAQRLLRVLEAEGVGLPPTAGRRTRRPTYTQGILLPAAASGVEAEVVRALEALDPSSMTPLQALAWITSWRAKLERPPAAEAR